MNLHMLGPEKTSLTYMQNLTSFLAFQMQKLCLACNYYRVMHTSNGYAKQKRSEVNQSNSLHMTKDWDQEV